MIPGNDPEQLARDLLGCELEDLEEEEQIVIRRVASSRYVGLDASETARLEDGLGDRLADRVAAVGGSWAFILSFAFVLLAWMLINSEGARTLGLAPFDAFPFIFLNLMLSTLAALQAPVIMMSQNRQAKKDRIAARHDYEVNLRTQLEILRLSRKIDKIARLGLRAAREVEEVVVSETRRDEVS